MVSCNEIKRHNLQTAASDELTWVVIQRHSEQLMFVNLATIPRLDKKQVVSQVNERNEMWQRSCVELIPFIAAPKEEWKKQEVTREMAYFKVQNKRKCVLRIECQKYRKKMEAWESLGVQFLVMHLFSGGMGFVTYANFGQPELV